MASPARRLGRWTTPTIVASIILPLASSSDAYAQKASGLNIFRSNAAQVNGIDVALKADNGQWLIYAYTMEGEDSKMRSLKLCAELRDKFKLKAYIMQKSFDFTETVIGNGVDQRGREKRMKYVSDRGQVVESYSIMIGDFTSPDTPDAKEAMKKIKTLKPEFFATDRQEIQTGGERVRAFRESYTPTEELEKGPFQGAMFTRNPLLPAEYFQAPELDEFITKLNKNADYSILDCKGRFTVRVAHFTGESQVMLSKSQKANANGDLASASLDYAAVKANQLATLLRRAGYDAYEYHDKNSSSVCVGSFEELGGMDANGQFMYSPDVMKIVEEFGGAKNFKDTRYGQLPVVKTLLDVVSYKKYPELTEGTEAEKKAKVLDYSIAFEEVPKPIFVPRPKTSGLYKKSLLGKF
jgi:hypothetical protein